MTPLVCYVMLFDRSEMVMFSGPEGDRILLTRLLGVLAGLILWSWMVSFGPLGGRQTGERSGPWSSRYLHRRQGLGESDVDSRDEHGSRQDLSDFNDGESNHHAQTRYGGDAPMTGANATGNSIGARVKHLEQLLAEARKVRLDQSHEIQSLVQKRTEQDEQRLRLMAVQNQLEAQIVTLREQISHESARRQQIQSALDANEQKYRCLLDGVSDSIFLTSAAGMIEYASAATQGLFAMPAEYFLGAHVNFAVEEDRLRVEGFLRECQQRSNIVYRIACQLGPVTVIKHISHRVNILEITGKRRVLIHSLSDISSTFEVERQKLEYERQLVHASKLASLGTMGAGVAHELNNPITVIKGYLERIRKELLLTVGESHSMLTMIDKVLKQVGRMQVITDQLRVFSRREVRQDQWTMVSLERVIQDALELQRHLLSGSQIELRLEIAEPSPTVLVNPTNFESVIQNLVGNAYDAHLSRRESSLRRNSSTPSSEAERAAIKATDMEIARPFIKIKAYQPSEECITLEVSDNAGGIPAAIVTKIFDPYFTTKAPGKGTGLGLALVQSIVTNHKGRLQCETKEGYGTTFRIELPSGNRQSAQIEGLKVGSSDVMV